MIYFTSDNHYFHDNIIKYCERPFSDSFEMNKEMLKRWNDHVGAEDVGVFVGDLSAGLRKRTEELREIIQGLNGVKILIRGNHDHQPDQWYLESGFIGVFDHLNLGGVLLCHYPERAFVERNVNTENFGDYSHIVHGHVHAQFPNYERHFNVAVDRNNFMPIPYTEVMPEHFHEPFKKNLENLILNTTQKKFTL
jgi:calcineurin-like phosphoesterase family protein